MNVDDSGVADPRYVGRQKAKMSPKMPGVRRDRQEGLCDRVKEEGVEALWVPQGQGIQCIGEGKHHVEIGLMHCGT
jgi:hypothetical protein